MELHRPCVDIQCTGLAPALTWVAFLPETWKKSVEGTVCSQEELEDKRELDS